MIALGKKNKFLSGVVAFFAVVFFFAGHAHASDSHSGVISNWWTWGNQANPPFGFALINFSAFLVVLHFTVGKQLRNYFRNRHDQVAHATQLAADRSAAAEQLLRSTQKQRTEIENLRQQWTTEMRSEMKTEQQRLEKWTEDQVLRLRFEMESSVRLEISKGQMDIQQALAGALASQLESLLQREIQPTDQDRLNRVSVDALIHAWVPAKKGDQEGHVS